MILCLANVTLVWSVFQEHVRSDQLFANFHSTYDILSFRIIYKCFSQLIILHRIDFMRTFPCGVDYYVGWYCSQSNIFRFGVATYVFWNKVPNQGLANIQSAGSERQIVTFNFSVTPQRVDLNGKYGKQKNRKWRHLYEARIDAWYFKTRMLNRIKRRTEKIAIRVTRTVSVIKSFNG